MVDVGFILHPTTTTTSPPPPQLAPNHGAHAHMVPLPSPEGCGPIAVTFNEGNRDGD